MSGPQKRIVIAVSDVCALAFVDGLLPDQLCIPWRRLLVGFRGRGSLPVTLFGLLLPPDARTFPLSDSVAFEALDVGYHLLLCFTVCKSTQMDGLA